MLEIDLDFPGKTVFMMGNEAIARGALEAGIGFAAAYPGTPSTEILNTISGVAKRRNIHAEWSVNEIVAMEAATGASLAGIRAMASMKQNGVHVSTDFLGNLVMGNINAGLVLVSCDDPGSRTSTNEQDTRPVAKWLGIPMFEPSDFQEAKDMTKALFDISEELETVSMLRTTSRISHSRGNVQLGEFSVRQLKTHLDFEKIGHGDLKMLWADSVRGTSLTRTAALNQKLKKAREKFESSPFNQYIGPEEPELLIITSGVCWLHARLALKILHLEQKIGILKLGTIWPLPEELVKRCLTKSERILFLEEIEPFLEGSVMELIATLPPSVQRPTLYGKRSGHINAYGELSPDAIMNVISEIVGIAIPRRDADYERRAEVASKTCVIPRIGSSCPGCPHKASWWAIRNAIRKDGRSGFAISDIGCYGFGLLPEGYSIAKATYCMGGGAGVANGLGQLGQFDFDQPVIGICGDSTFFHACIPALINGIYNKSNFILVIFDNSTTAMTGFQPHPGTGKTATDIQTRAVDIEAICRSMGTRVEVCDPFDLKNTTATMLDLLRDEKNDVRVIIMKRECELVRARKNKPPFRMRIDPDKCNGDQLCTRVFGCAGLIWNKETRKAEIDEVACAGCGVCADICPREAIVKEEYKERGTNE